MDISKLSFSSNSPRLSSSKTFSWSKEEYSILIFDSDSRNNSSLSFNSSISWVSLVKDASETAIYGSRAANGVVIITTKKGRKNAEPIINVGVQYGFSNLANTDFFERLMNTEQYTNFQVDAGIRSQAQVDAILAENNADTRWYKWYYKDDAPMQQVNISAQGGSEKTSYFY